MATTMTMSFARDHALNDMLRHLRDDRTIPGARRVRYFGAISKADRNIELLNRLLGKLKVSDYDEIEGAIDALRAKASQRQQKAQPKKAAAAAKDAEAAMPAGAETTPTGEVIETAPKPAPSTTAATAKAPAQSKTATSTKPAATASTGKAAGTTSSTTKPASTAGGVERPAARKAAAR